MAITIPIWPGSSSFSPGATQFGFFDTDQIFQDHADKVSSWCATRLGYPLNDVELQSIHFYACFEEATSEYGAQVNQFNIRNNLFLLRGQDNSNSFTQKMVDGAGLATVYRIAQTYGTLAGAGGDVKIKKAYFNLDTTTNRQRYDLSTELYSAESGSFGQKLDVNVKKDITRVFYEATPAIVRFFDPYSVGAQGTLNLMSELGFGNYSPAAQFLMMPLYEDVLRMQAIEFNDHIRKSAFTFNIVDNKISVFPAPSSINPVTKLYFDYFERTDFEENSAIVKDNSISDYSNIKYDLDMNANNPLQMLSSLYNSNEQMLVDLKECFNVATSANEQGLANFIAERIDVQEKLGWKLRASMKSMGSN